MAEQPARLDLAGREGEIPELADLVDQDHGLFYVALHAFVAGFIERTEGRSDGADFGGKLDALADRLRREEAFTPAARRVIGTLRASHHLSDRIAEGEASVTREEVAAATHTFIEWCRLVGFGSTSIAHIRRGLRLWMDEGAAGPRTETARELESALGSERSEMDYLRRFAAYTRSRGDYERSVLDLSTEQREIVERMRGGGDYLISGPPGTGKTVVLLHALDQDLAEADAELGLTREPPFTLLTYTRTLVRFSVYLSHILGNHRTTPEISTVDAFLLSRLKAIRSDAYVVFSSRAAEEFSAVLEDGPGDPGSLFREVEEVIFAGRLTEEEYIRGEQRKRGMPPAIPVDPSQGPLGLDPGTADGAAARRRVWGISRLMLAQMQERGGYTKNCAAQLILDHAPEAAPSRRIYVDESQDLSPVDIATLKRLTRDGLILAGDQNQRIYQLGLSYRDAGLELRGRGKTLRRNYRNTDSIRKLASAYRQLAGERLPERFRGEGAGDAESTAWPAAPRTGPQPRVVRAENYEAGAAQVVEWAARYLREIGYEPENVAILAPSNDDLRELLPLLEAAGLPACNVRSRGFEFEKSAGVRLSTLHSAKGVEFPVVLLFLPPLRERAEPDPDRSAALQYNTIYVAITRAMDSLHVVAAEPIAHPQVQAVFEAARRAADA